MRLLIDECVDPRVKSLFPGHEVSTVYELGWDSAKDRELLKLAQEQFDVLLTIDRGLEFQQNLSKLQLAIIVAHVPKNQMTYYRVLLPQLTQAVDSGRPGLVVHVGLPPV
jgi:hypothetical protein